MNQPNELDLLIIGAGSAGISAAVEARRADIERIKVLEKGPTRTLLPSTCVCINLRAWLEYATLTP